MTTTVAIKAVIVEGEMAFDVTRLCKIGLLGGWKIRLRVSFAKLYTPTLGQTSRLPEGRVGGSHSEQQTPVPVYCCIRWGSRYAMKPLLHVQAAVLRGACYYRP